MDRLELLSPAGDLSIFEAVVDAGADAVYFGGDLFGARAYAKNFSIEDAKKAIKYAHLHSAKAYLTVNTLLKNVEIEKSLYQYLKAYVENGIDAFIVQDFGVFQFIKEHFPDTHIHASTQMSLCTKEGAKFIQDAGAKRIVTARELSIKEIESIHKAAPDLEIESFVHGALCVCYSGQCLMSSILGGRSGNRGRCAQPCRLAYSLKSSEGRPIDLPGQYVLSPKDFCTINKLPEMIEAGVTSFKIEGRMKQISYATGVVSIYRKYVDEYLYRGKNNYSVTQDDIKKLMDYGNRSGFTDLYLTKHNGPEMMTFVEPGHNKADTSVPNIKKKNLSIDCNVKAIVNQPLYISFSDENGNKGECMGPILELAQNRATTYEEIKKSVSQIGDTAFTLNKLIIDYDENLFIPVSVIKKVRRAAVEAYSAQLLGNKSTRILDFKELKTSNNKITKLNTRALSVSINNINQFKIVNKYDYVDEINVPLELYDSVKDITSDKNITLVLPEVLREEDFSKIKLPDSKHNILARTYDELGYLNSIDYPRKLIKLDHRLYTFSNRAVKAFDSLGYGDNCAPYELSLKELKHRDNSNSQMIIYSRIPLMITANCSIKNAYGCQKNNDIYYLKDRKNENHVVKCNCSYCYNTIYNSQKYIAFDFVDEIADMNFKGLRMDFTVEGEKEIRNIFALYEAVVLSKDGKVEFEHTNGHLKRGVE